MNKEKYYDAPTLRAWVGEASRGFRVVEGDDYDALAAENERLREESFEPLYNAVIDERDALTARVAELERDAQCFEWLAERLTDVIVDGADPTEHYDDGPNSATDLWRRAIRAAMAAKEA